MKTQHQRTATKPESGAHAQAPTSEPTDLGSNAQAQQAMLESQGDGGQDFAFTSEESDANMEQGAEEELQRRQRQQRVDDLQRTFSGYAKTIAQEVTAARRHAEAAQEAVATGQSKAYESAVDAFETELREGATPGLLAGIEQQYGDAAGTVFFTDVDASGLQQTLAAIVDMAHLQLPPGLGYLFIAREYRGDSGTHSFTVPPPVQPPTPAVAVWLLDDELSGWVDVAETWSREVLPFLEQVPETKAFGETFPSEKPRNRFMSDEPEETLEAVEDRFFLYNPNYKHEGRARQYLDAVLADALPEWLSVYVDPDRIKTRDEMHLEDRVGPGQEVDFDKLESILDTIDSELNDTNLDDDVVLAALDKAETPEERDYIMNRLFNTNHDGSIKITALKSRFWDDGHDAFEDWRAGAGEHSGGSGDWGRESGVLDAAATGVQLLPAATVATASGMVSSIPIAGDYYEQGVGKDVQAFGHGLSTFAGASDEEAAMASMIGNFSGKIAGAIGQAHLTGQAGALLKGAGTAGKVGGAGLASMTAAQKATTAVGATLQVADVANNASQAVNGEKLTGEKISTGERWAAGVGAFLGGAEVFGMAKAARTADAIKPVKPPGPVLPGPDLSGRHMDATDVPFGQAARREVVPEANTASFGERLVDGAKGSLPNVIKSADGQQKVDGVEDSVAELTDEQVLAKLEEHGHRNDVIAALNHFHLRGDIAPARHVLREIEGSPAHSARNEGGFGAAADLAGAFAR